MHELSIAQALLEGVARHTPPDAILQKVRVRIGPLHSIVPEAMTFAWSAATAGGPFEGALLEIEYLPWTLTCTDCERQWQGCGPVRDLHLRR
jgi:Zn finger protein HypA/HybF involved in hydrogenase expression